MAIHIALDAHKGAVDKGGAPYILHPLRLMLQMETTAEQIVAVLHDVVEDSHWSIEKLRQEQFEDDILNAIDCLTKRPAESYDKFIDRLKSNPIAKVVKIADLKDNMDISRIPTLTKKDLERVEKYNKALTSLTT